MADRWTRVLDELRRRFPAEVEAGAVAAFLASRGYNRQQIGEILSLRTAQIDGVSTLSPGWSSMPERVRVQGPHERGRFSAEAWGYLLALGATAALPAAAFEHLVERALSQAEGRIELDDVRFLAASVGLDGPFPEGGRSRFH